MKGQRVFIQKVRLLGKLSSDCLNSFWFPEDKSEGKHKMFRIFG